MSTIDDLKEAFAGESQANRRYLAYAEKAETEGFPGVAKLLRAVAAAETVHALNHLKAIGAVGGTVANLTEAMAGEKYEFTEMYPPMLAGAEAEGHKKGARSMRFALEVEKVHYDLFGKALEAVAAGKDLGDVTVHVCPVCGHTVIGPVEGPCPVCGCRPDLYDDIA
ncbi:MAG: rubrerythrin family protein [Phyllobacteriaceae bacterium]|nr:rubrerythrin family protein [Phyllobacteriaceae bacterium]